MEKKLNEEYWLLQGYNLVDSGLTRVYKHIENLEKYLIGLTSIYVVSSIVEIVYLKIDHFWQFIILVVPVVFLYLGILIATLAKIPKIKEFFALSPESCRETYYDYLDDSEKHLKTLKIISSLATLFMIIAIIFNTYYSIQIKREDTQEKYKNADLNYFEVKPYGENEGFVLGGNFPKNQAVKLSIKLKDSILIKTPILIKDDGILHFVYSDTINEKSYDKLSFLIQYKKSPNESKIIIKGID